MGICVFRLPAKDDPAALNIEQVTDALNDRDSHPAIYVLLKQQEQIKNTHALTFEIKNFGTTNPIIGSLKVDLTVPAGSFEAMQPQSGVSIQPLCAAYGSQPCGQRRADLLRLTIDYLAPGRSLTTTLLLNRALPGTTDVSVAMQTETEHSYSTQNKIFTEPGVK